MATVVSSTRALTAAMLAFGLLVNATSDAQSPESAPRVSSTDETAGRDWTPPRTAWGDPDIEGYVTNVGMRSVPLERAIELGEQRFWTDEQYAERVRNDELARQRALDDALSTERQVRQLTYRGAEPVLSGPTHWGERGVNTPRQTSLIIDPPNGRIPPLTEEAQRRPRRVSPRGSTAGGIFDGPEDLSDFDRCITRGLPGSMMPAIYGNSYQIVQAPGFVAIRYEMINATRVIPLDGSPHSALPAYMGDARGRWEGDTLVVETRRFKRPYRGSDPETTRLIERFTRVAQNTIEWTVTVDDPTTWTQPWTFSMPLTIDNTQYVFEYACHEGNYAMRNILSASRAAEGNSSQTVDTSDDVDAR